MEDKRGRIPDKKDRIPGNKPFCTYKHTPSSRKKMPLGLTCMPIESKGCKLTEACMLLKCRNTSKQLLSNIPHKWENPSLYKPKRMLRHRKNQQRIYTLLLSKDKTKL